MALSTLAGFRAARKHQIRLVDDTPNAAVAGLQTSFKQPPRSLDRTVGPTYAVPDGFVPVSGSPGYPTLPTVGGGNSLYLIGANYWPTLNTQTRFECFDCLFVSGEHSTNGTVDVTFSSPPTSWQSRVSSYHDLEIWIEVQGAALVGSTAVIVDYQDADNVARSTPSFLIPNLNIGMAYQLPLQAGTKGCQGLTGIHISGGSSATAKINVRLMRPLIGWAHYFEAANVLQSQASIFDALCQVPLDAALFMYARSSTSGRAVELSLDFAEG